MVKSDKSVIKFKELAQLKTPNLHGRGYCFLFLGSKRLRYSFVLRSNRIIVQNITAKFHKPKECERYKRKHVRFEKKAIFIDKTLQLQKIDVGTQYDRCARRLTQDKAVNTDPSCESTIEEVVQIQNLNGGCSSCKINRRKKRKQYNQFKANALHRAESIENQLLLQNSLLQQLVKLFDSSNKIDRSTSTILDDVNSKSPDSDLGQAATKSHSSEPLHKDEPTVEKMSRQNKISVWRKIFSCYS